MRTSFSPLGRRFGAARATCLAIAIIAAQDVDRVAHASSTPGCEPVPARLRGVSEFLLLGLDPADGRTTALSGMGLLGYASDVRAMTYDPTSRLLFASDLASGHLISIDPASGAIVPLGPIGFGGVRGLAYDAISNQLYGLDSITSQLLRVDRSTGRGTALGALGDRQLAGLAFDSTARVLYTIHTSTRMLLSVDPGTLDVTEARKDTGFSEVTGLAYDPRDRTIYAVDAASSRLITIHRVTGDGRAVGDLDSSPPIYTLAFDTQNQRIYALQTGTGRLMAINMSTGAAVSTGSPSAFGEVSGLVYDPSAGELFGVDAGAGVLIRIDLASGLALARGAIGFSGVRDLALHPGTGALYGISSSSGQLLLINKATGAGTPAGVTGLGCVAGLGFHPLTQILYGTDTCSDTLIRIALPGGTRTTVGPLGFNNVGSLSWDGSGFLGIDEDSGRLISIDPGTGAGTARGPVGFGGVRSVAADSLGGRVFAVSTSIDALLQLDPASGMATTVRRIGGNDLRGMTFDSESAMLYAADAATGLLVQIDARTGSSRIVGALGDSLRVEGLARHPATGVVYGADRQNSRLVKIDLATGQVTPVGPFSRDGMSGLAFDDAGVLYGTEASATNLFTINLGSGAASVVGPLGLPGSAAVTGLAYAPSTGRLLAADSTGSRLLSIDRSTGAAAVIGPLGLSHVQAMEWTGSVVPPECRHDFRYSLVPRRTPSSSDFGELPASDASLPCMQPFYLEFWARDEGFENTGVTCAFADIVYDAARLQVLNITHAAAYGQPPSASGQDNGAGRIEELGGCHLPASPDDVFGEDPAWVCIARVEMLPFEDECGRSCSVATALLTEPADNEASAYGRGTVAPSDIIHASASPGLECTCLYDLNGDCLINATDLGIMAPSWRKCAGEAGFDPRSDLDCSGCFAGGDIGFLATAWLRECADARVVFASCKGCGPAGVQAAMHASGTDGPGVQFALRLSGEPAELTVTDELPAGLTSTRAGQTVFAEFWMRDLHPASSGLVAGYADLYFAPDDFEVVHAQASPGFRLLASGEAGTGRVSELGGATVITGEDPSRWVRVATAELLSKVDSDLPRAWLRPSPLDPAARYGQGAVPADHIEVIQPVPLFSRADFDQDGDVDQSDFGVLQACFTGADGGTPAMLARCLRADLDFDGHVDLRDYQVFLGCVSGPAVASAGSCMH